MEPIIDPVTDEEEHLSIADQEPEVDSVSGEDAPTEWRSKVRVLQYSRSDLLI